MQVDLHLVSTASRVLSCLVKVTSSWIQNYVSFSFENQDVTMDIIAGMIKYWLRPWSFWRIFLISFADYISFSLYRYGHMLIQIEQDSLVDQSFIMLLSL